MTEEATKVSVKGVRRVAALVSNEADTGRQYAIEAEVEYAGGTTGNITKGAVSALDGGGQLANFTRYGGALSVNFMPGSGADPVQLLEAISQFMDGAEALAGSYEMQVAAM